jgi:hypothetical protein
MVLVHMSTMDRAQGVSPRHDLDCPRVIKRPRWPASVRTAASVPEAAAHGGWLAGTALDRAVRP